MNVPNPVRSFQPLDHPTARQVVHRRGEIETPHFRGYEVWTSTEQLPTGRRVTSEWTVFLDFGPGAWVHFQCLCEGEMDQEVWARVLDSIRFGRLTAPEHFSF